MKEKRLVLTICIGDFYKELSKVTHPKIKNYAKKIGADFKVIKKTNLKYPHYEKFQMWKLLDKYDRILYIDSDILLRPDTPDIFTIVPTNMIGMLDESPLGYDKVFKEFLLEYAPEYLIPWNEHKKCYNAGVIVCSKVHKKIFSLPEFLPNHYFEQSYLNLRILQEKVKVFELPLKYNRMIYFDLLSNEHRLKSFIVHYAGFIEKRPIDECIKFFDKEYKMMLSGDFSEDDVHLAWAPLESK